MRRCLSRRGDPQNPASFRCFLDLAGGGSIPLRHSASALKPTPRTSILVLINKALVEVTPRFTGRESHPSGWWCAAATSGRRALPGRSVTAER